MVTKGRLGELDEKGNRILVLAQRRGVVLQGSRRLGGEGRGGGSELEDPTGLTGVKRYRGNETFGNVGRDTICSRKTSFLLLGCIPTHIRVCVCVYNFVYKFNYCRTLFHLKTT